MPDCLDPKRSPDPSTIRRWMQRRLVSVWCWLKAGMMGVQILHTATIVAWDLEAVCRILRIEAKSP